MIYDITVPRICKHSLTRYYIWGHIYLTSYRLHVTRLTLKTPEFMRKKRVVEIVWAYFDIKKLHYKFEVTFVRLIQWRLLLGCNVHQMVASSAADAPQWIHPSDKPYQITDLKYDVAPFIFEIQLILNHYLELS